jgi:phenylalanyl-tRNA synthetase alpha chain
VKVYAGMCINVYTTNNTHTHTELKKKHTDLTSTMLRAGNCEDADMKEYDFSVYSAQAIPHGCQHPLMKVRAEFKKVLLQMGFSEMKTDNYVESSFWNFDTLFQPQQHPARDAHDTFFLSQPAECKELPGEGYTETVKRTHEQGGFGSIGYRYDWKHSEAKKNILRTHTTAVSSRTLRALAQAMQEGE